MRQLLVLCVLLGVFSCALAKPFGIEQAKPVGPRRGYPTKIDPMPSFDGPPFGVWDGGFDGPLAPNYTAQSWFLMQMYHDGIPHSYYVPASYWRSSWYLPDAHHSNPIWNNTSILDRTLSTYGINLYDAATWQIALSLMNEFELPHAYEELVLFPSSTGCDPSVGGLCTLRSSTSDYEYGPNQTPGSSLAMVPVPGGGSPLQPQTQLPGAFYFRMISNTYVTEDPLIGSYSPDFVYPTPCSSCDSWNTFGVIVWDDWKPITGENVWATITGPLNVLMLENDGAIPQWSSYSDAPASVQLGLTILPALMALQSPLGSLYHCPKGANINPPDPNEGQNVSNENNASGLAAINMLIALLKNNTINYQSSDLNDEINDLVSLRTGLMDWFREYALAPPLSDTGNRWFYQGGHVNFTGSNYYPVGIDQHGGFAVDCQTWTMAILGQSFVDTEMNGTEVGTAYGVWQQTKDFSQYLNPDDQSLAGVGFTKGHVMWTAEWSFGAVMMARRLADGYEANGCANCATWAANLRADADSMVTNLSKMTADGGMQSSTGGYLYANHRYLIPWGWYANPIPSLCATAWSIMNDFNYNPFQLGGGLYPTLPDDQLF